MSTAPDSTWAVVLGGSGALGGMISLRLAQSGLCVLAVGRRSAPLAAVARSHPRITGVEADLAKDASMATISDAVLGPVRMIVQAAGLPASGALTSVEPTALGEAVNIKAGGLLRTVRALEDRLAPRTRIVSLGGHYGAEPSSAATAAGITNAALANLNRQFADVYGSRGITAHLIAPGPVETERLQKIAAAIAAERHITSEVAMQEMRASSPLGRLTSPEQVSWAVAMLLDEEADALTGSILALDSGERHGVT